jgi:hypothetical protein
MVLLQVDWHAFYSSNNGKSFYNSATVVNVSICDIMKNPGMQWALKMMDKAILRYIHPCPYEVSKLFSLKLSTVIETLPFEFYIAGIYEFFGPPS